MSFYTSALRPALFMLDADRSHALAHAVLRCPLPFKWLGHLQGLMIDDPRLRTRIAGVDLPNPIGLAAGLDKNAEVTAALGALGFGFVTVGSLMPEARYGNPFPRIVRYRDRESLADSMGVPSKGRAYAIERLRKRRAGRAAVFANVGGFSARDIAAAVRETLPLVDAVELSLMCPNALKPGEVFDELAMLSGILDEVGDSASRLIVRVPNDTTRVPERFAALIDMAATAGMGGIKVGGGRPVAEPGLGTGRGTLHGRDIFEAALANVTFASKVAAGRIPIKGNGGIRNAGDVMQMLDAGACCVDLFSAFIYQGWTVARDINRDLLSAGVTLPASSTGSV